MLLCRLCVIEHGQTIRDTFEDQIALNEHLETVHHLVVVITDFVLVNIQGDHRRAYGPLTYAEAAGLQQAVQADAADPYGVYLLELTRDHPFLEEG